MGKQKIDREEYCDGKGKADRRAVRIGMKEEGQPGGGNQYIDKEEARNYPQRGGNISIHTPISNGGNHCKKYTEGQSRKRSLSAKIRRESVTEKRKLTLNDKEDPQKKLNYPTGPVLYGGEAKKAWES